MKKIIIRFIAILFVFLCSLFLFNSISYAGSQHLNNLEYDVKLNEDGSANISEIWDIQVSSTNTLFKTFDIDKSKYGDITNVSVVDITDNEKIVEFTKTDEYAYHVQKGYFYALKTKSTEFEIAWGVSINSTENRKYRINYKVTDAIKTYNDCSEFYWMFISTSNGIPAEKVSGTIKLPKPVSSKDNIKVWAHGPLQGEIYATDNQTVSFKLNYLDTETMVEARVAVLENIFTTNNNKVNQDKLQKIISEETGWAEKANRERDRLRAREERNALIMTIIKDVIIGIVIALFILIVTKIKKYAKHLSGLKKLEPEMKCEYFRDFPDENATPGEAAFLYYYNKDLFSKNVSKVVSASIMDLALKKIISFDEDPKNKMDIIIDETVDTSKLKKDEFEIFNLLVCVNRYKNKKNKNKTEENLNSISMKDIEKYAKHNDSSFLATIDGLKDKEEYIHEENKNFDRSKKFEAKEWSKKSSNYFACIFACLISISLLYLFGIWYVALVNVIPLVICDILCSIIAKRTRNLALTQKGINEQEQWIGLKKYMEEFSLLNEREVPELVLWEKYLVYATAFGIADKVLKQLKVQYPELNDEEYLRNNRYTYMYMMNRYNFDRTLNSSMQKAYQSGLRARAAREAAYSSYSSGGGGGGGFSGGGGRRWWPVAGMGGR